MAWQWQSTEWTDDWTGWNENGWISGATQASAEQPATDGWTGWNDNGWISAATNASAEKPASHAQGRLDSAPTQSRIEQQREQQRQTVEERGAEQPALRLDDTQPVCAAALPFSIDAATPATATATATAAATMTGTGCLLHTQKLRWTACS